MLAADNILFNARLSSDKKSVLIEPHVMVDLHDFEIIIDDESGFMYAFPGGHTPSLRDRVTTNPSLGINDPSTLYDQFCSWTRERLGMPKARTKGEQDVRHQVMNNKRIAGLILLQQGKRYLSKGDVDRAIEAFGKARTADLAAVYFWGAVAHQYRFLKSYRYDFGGGKVGEAERRDYLLNAAISTLIDSLKTSAQAQLSSGL
jgi:hypothetical protein